MALEDATAGTRPPGSLLPLALRERDGVLLPLEMMTVKGRCAGRVWTVFSVRSLTVHTTSNEEVNRQHVHCFSAWRLLWTSKTARSSCTPVAVSFAPTPTGCRSCCC